MAHNTIKWVTDDYISSHSMKRIVADLNELEDRIEGHGELDRYHASLLKAIYFLEPISLKLEQGQRKGEVVISD